MYSGSNPLETSFLNRSLKINKIVKVKSLILFSFLFSFSKPLIAKINIDKDTIKIYCWNIQMLPNFYSPFTKYVRKKQKLRLPYIIEYLDSANFDVVILQEAFDLQAIKQLNKNLKLTYPFIQNPIKKGRGLKLTNGIMILSKHEMTYLDNIRFSNTTGIEKMAKKSCVLVSVEINNKSLLVAGTHLSSNSQNDRNNQYNKINDFIIKPYKTEGVPFFLAGDFNTVYNSESFIDMLSIFKLNCSEFINNNKPFTFAESNTWNKQYENYNVWIDFILHDLASSFKVIKQNIYTPYITYKEKKIDLSDHYGIELQLLHRF